MDATEVEELLFFDTFSHDASEEINLDLVQFPKPVIISEVRIIPLGARVQADFPGGVRLGATNPSQFRIEFFVNDLSKHGASTFETIGGLEYKQSSDINLECVHKKIPTDGLILRGWYTTITLAVYGSLTKVLTPLLQDPRSGELSASAATAEWVQSQQGAIYRDPAYSYPPDFPPNASQQAYVEPWPSAPVPTAAVSGNHSTNDPVYQNVIGISDPYDEDLAPNWEEQATEEIKPWPAKDDLVKGPSPVRSSGGDSTSKVRLREEYWDERDDRLDRKRQDDDSKRFKEREQTQDEDRRRERSSDRSWRDTAETKSRISKTLRECSWDREHSPYSDTSFRRRPKSPSSRSPKRPSTPTERFWSPERKGYRSPNNRNTTSTRSASPPKVLRVGEQLRVDVSGSPQTPLQSPVPLTRPEDHNIDEEQFEPILSDEDIIDECDSQQFPDVDYDFVDDLDDVVKSFNPFAFQMDVLKNLPNPDNTLCELFQGNQSDCQALDAVKELVTNLTLDSHEDWIIAVEQLPTLLPPALSCGVESVVAEKLIAWVEHGLNLDAALYHTAPGSKLRHIKGGVRLAESLCHCGLTERLVNQTLLHEKLLNLFLSEHMALSIRLLILQTLDSMFLDKAALRILLTREWLLEIDKKKEVVSTYHHLLRMLSDKQQVRIKFAITSMLQKIHIDEVLVNLQNMGEQLLTGKNVVDDELVLCLRAIQRIFIHCATLIAQPRRFLPVQSQFGVHIDPKPSYLFLYRCFKDRKLLETILLLLTSRLCGAPAEAAACELLRDMSKTLHGLIFLGYSPAINAILKVLQACEDYSDSYNGASLALELPFKLQTLLSLDRLLVISNENEAFSVLHDLYCVTLHPAGKFHVATTLALEDNIQIMLRMASNYDRKSVVHSYVGDFADLTIRYSDNINFIKTNYKVLSEMASSEVSDKLRENHSWILASQNLFEDVVALCDLLNKHSVKEFNGTFPGEVITCVRALRNLCLPLITSLPESLEDENVAYRELRFKHSALQLYSLDGLVHLTALLSKMISFYEQPFAQSASLVGSQGFNIVSFVEPAILLIRRMLSYLIEVRGAEFKDITHVNILLDVYALMKAFPSSAEAYNQALAVSRQIIETLLVYTDPAAQTEIYSKSIWTLMLTDVLKFILKAPYCLMPGFELLSELLPLPLPMQSKSSLSEGELSELRSARQLWSAHVHPLAGPLHDLFAALAGSSYPPLLQMMRRAAVQLADIAAPTALIIARAVLDPLLATLANTESSWEIPVAPKSARLLHFLASLAPHPAIKAAVLSLITAGANARTDEKLLTIVDALILILKTPCSTPAHTQAQECVLLLIQALVDADVTLIPLNGSPKFLASALPGRDLLTSITGALLDHISAPDHPMTCLLLALKPLILLTDNDCGFYKFKMSLESRRDAIFNLLSRLNGELRREHTDALNTLHGTLALLREFVLDAPSPMRTLTMTPDELGRALRWGENSHPLINIHQCLREWSATDESLTNLCESAGDLLKLLGSSKQESASTQTKDDTTVVTEEEPVLIPALSLMEQFSARPVIINGEPDIKSLSSAYWLSLPVPEEVDQEGEQVPCDLLELCASFLPDIHLLHEVQRVCHLKIYEEDGKKAENSKYEMSGSRTRRPFVTPMRGRGGRPTQQRGDVFRSRPPNTSRPPSLHVDDFVALETCGQQPTGPTGYNKVSVRNIKEVIGNRIRGRGRVFGTAPYPRRENIRGRGVIHDDLRALPASRFRAWQTEDLRRIHPFPR